MNTLKRSIILPLTVALLGVGFWAGCESSLFSDMDSSGASTFHVLLTDAPFPFDLVKEANVTIDEVQLVPAGSAESETETENDNASSSIAGKAATGLNSDTTEGGIITLKSDWMVDGETQETVSYNLLELRNDVTATLAGDLEIPAGTYSEIRLLIDGEASLVDTNGTVYNLKVPSGTQTGIKIQLENLEIVGDSETTVTLDFNLEDSFVLRGNPNKPSDLNGMIFKPVVHLKSVAEGSPEEADSTPEDSEETSDNSDDGTSSTSE